MKGVALDVKNLTSKTYELQPKDVALTADILKKIVTTNVTDAQVYKRNLLFTNCFSTFDFNYTYFFGMNVTKTFILIGQPVQLTG